MNHLNFGYTKGQQTLRNVSLSIDKGEMVSIVGRNGAGSKDSIYKGGLHQPGSKDFISDENLFNYQAKVVNDLAEKESYVIVGRCVNYVFKDRPNTLRVFIHAPWEFRVEKASEKISGSREDVEKFLLKDDKRKQDYYRKFAGGIWNDATNYDLCLNSGKLGFEKCVDVIEAQLKIMLNK